MRTKEVVNVESTKSHDLETEVYRLFRDSISVRHAMGATQSLQLGYIREAVECGDEEPFFTTTQQQCESPCEEDTKLDCEEELEELCSMEEVAEQYKAQSPFKSVANLLTTVKKYEFISLVENAYAQIGNKPFKLKASKEPVPSNDQIKESAETFYEFLENYLEANEVRIDEIKDAFNLDTLGEVTKALADTIEEEINNSTQESIDSNEIVIEKVFKRADFMNKYIEVIKDTTDYPIGVMWIDDLALKKEKYISGGKLKFKYSIQCDANRVDPCYFWATEDHRLNEPGRAVFKLAQYTRGEIIQWKEKNVTGSTEITTSLDEFLDTYEDGYKMHEAMLFNDHKQLNAGMYDVMVSRGQFDVSSLKDLNIKIPEIYNAESHVPCEIYFAGNKLLRVRVMECTDERLGVYTTVFRRRGQSIFGYSLHEFVYPFAKLYAGAIDAVDRSVGKSTGSIIQIDTSVIQDAEKYLTKNADGEVVLDLSSDLIVEFDSREAFSAPNFKGVPITIDQLPSDLSKLLPVVEFTIKQIELISGIPSILVNGSNVSSALRTTSNFNAAFAASAKVIQALLRESENRILKPSIKYIFETKAASGEMKDFLVETEPEILLSDTLTRELNNDQQLLQGVQSLAQFSQLIPQENLAGLVNKVGREVYNLDEDLIPGVGTLKTATPATPAQSV